MSKYEPLKNFLTRSPDRELPMKFADIEGVLGFELPASARSHPAWWSNSHHNPAVQAWRQAGWLTAKVDLAGQRVVFVRDRAAPEARHINIPVEALQAATMRMLSERARLDSVDISTAAARMLDAQAIDGKRRLLDRFAKNSPKLATDSTSLIREDRDAR